MSNRFKSTKYIFFAIGGAVFCSAFGVYSSPIAQVFEGFIPPPATGQAFKADTITTKFNVNKTVPNSPE